MTESQQPKKKRGLNSQHKRVIRFSYEVLAGMYNPPWVAEAPEAVQRAYLAGQSMALKECAETAYWLELLFEADYITKAEYQSLAADCEEIRKMLSATTATIRKE